MNNRRETIFRDSDGDYKEWVPIMGVILLVLGVALFIAGICVGCELLSSKYESKAFNRIHGTEYTLAEWFWAESTIKDYHLGTVENKNFQVDLNIDDNRVEGGGLI